MLQQFSKTDSLLGKEGHFHPPMPTSPAPANASVKKRNAISRATGGILQPIIKVYNKTEGVHVRERGEKTKKRGTRLNENPVASIFSTTALTQC